jgi:pimeloyl-ACP methyl ester carboxylesterase
MSVAGVLRWRPGLDWPTAFLAGGLFLALWSFTGGPLLRQFLGRRKDDEPKPIRSPESRRLKRFDGTELYVEFYGPPDGPPVVLVPGWGADTTVWYYLRKQLGDRYRLIAFDLPGIGLSSRAQNNDYSMARFAGDLRAVLELAGDRPAVLLGHSMGAMLLLTFCRLFPEDLGRRVCGLVVVHGTYTNPLRTTQFSGLYTALQKPLIEPLAYLTMGISPLVWLLNWLSYLNGTVHLMMHLNLFAGTETRGQLDFTARYLPRVSPGVYARGTLGMLRFDETVTLGRIRVPALVVAGDRDVTTKPEASVRIHEGIPGSRLVTLSPSRHMGLLERHEEFGRAVVEFCDACAPRRPAEEAAGQAR